MIYLKVRVAAGGAIVSRAMRGLVRQGTRERQACLLIHQHQDCAHQETLSLYIYYTTAIAELGSWNIILLSGLSCTFSLKQRMKHYGLEQV